MTRLHHVVAVATPLEEAFALVADYSHLAEWDPGITRSARVDTGPLGIGSAFEVVAAIGGREVAISYQVVTYDAPHRVVLVGRGRAVKAIDDIEFRSVGAGTEIDVTADRGLTGPLRLAQPLFAPIARRLGAQAVTGLRERLGGI
jgi:carbon monoxide dehydrogenase subunit G